MLQNAQHAGFWSTFWKYNTNKLFA